MRSPRGRATPPPRARLGGLRQVVTDWLGEVPRRPLDVTLRDTIGARSVAASADERA
ncbi:MAG TPA: hypothetical protein VF516_08035 [Kofleriaceae bacterium]